jgi:hypothetical protein
LALTVEQVLALAPDASAAAAARTLAGSRAFRRLGSSARAVWGECQGSALYQVRFARDDLGARCTCPSRKFPCKHALGLMLVSVAREVPPAEEPGWVREWLENRTPGAAKPRRSEPAAPPDPVARAKRLEKRLERVRGGLDMLDLWIEDLVRDGIASLEERPPSFFGQMAARLVDAQAPGLARRVRRIGFLAGGDPGWPRAVVDELGLLALASHAFRRIDEIREPLRADLRQLVGFSLDKEEVVAAGERVEDTWMVVGQTVTEDERFRSQRTWLRGERTGRYALVLQFAAGDAPFEEMLVAGSRLAATVAFWPSAFPQRALVLERNVPEGSSAPGLLGFENVAAFLESSASAWAQAPFVERLCCTLRGATPICEENGFVVRDATGAMLPLAGREHWKLLAVSGGQPVDLAGEWNGRTLFPLATVAGGSFHVLADGGE